MPRYFAVGISAHNYAVAFTAEVARMCDVETWDSRGAWKRVVYATTDHHRSCGRSSLCSRNCKKRRLPLRRAVTRRQVSSWCYYSPYIIRNLWAFFSVLRGFNGWFSGVS